MKKFIKKISLSILFISVISCLFDITLSYYLKQSDQYPGEYEVMNDIYDGKATCDIAIYGSSRAWVHISPAILADTLNKSVYNFGIDGHNFRLQYMRHLEFIKHNAIPQIIILSVDLFSLQKSTNLYQQNQFLPYMLWNKNIKEYTSSYVGYRKADYYIPLIRYYGKKSVLRTCISVLTGNDGQARYRDRGFRGMDLQWNRDLEKAKEKTGSCEIDIDSDVVALFQQFILECKQSDIQPVLVYTPEYIEGQRFVKNRDDIIEIYFDYAKKYDLLFLDYSKNSLCKKKELFYNSTHLNSKGAELFSEILAGDLKSALQL